jgi:dolichol-phosphate mannosyltransferase
MITFTGVAATFLSIVAFVILGIVWLSRGVPFAGFGSIMSLVLLGFGLLTMMLGVMAEYLSLIYEEVKRRPNFVVREVIGIQ